MSKKRCLVIGGPDSGAVEFSENKRLLKNRIITRRKSFCVHEMMSQEHEMALAGRLDFCDEIFLFDLATEEDTHILKSFLLNNVIKTETALCCFIPDNQKVSDLYVYRFVATPYCDSLSSGRVWKAQLLNRTSLLIEKRFREVYTSYKIGP